MVRDQTSNHKRKSSITKGTGNSVKKKKTDNVYQEVSVFNELLNKCGITLKDGTANNEIGVDQAVFQRNLVLALKAHENYPEVIEDFFEGLHSYISEPCRFHKILMPTITKSDCESARASIQDSVMRIMMAVDMLQTQVMTLLLEKLPEFNGDDDHIVENGEKLFVPHLLLSQFRWLDRVVDCKLVTSKIISMISITSVDVQREIISCLPEVVEDTEHTTVAKALRDILLEGKQLTVAVLDALSNLNLTPDILSEVRGSVLQTLRSVELEDLPVVIKFLLQTVTAQDALEVVCEIRSNLDFKTSLQPKQSSTPLNNRSKQPSNDSSKGCEALTLDAIKAGIHFQKSVAEAFIKAIDSVKSAGDQKVIDLFVLFILHSTNRKKPIESLFRNKIRSGCFTEVLLQAAFTSHAQVLREYFPCILSLSEVLLRSPEPAISYMACSLYQHCFTAFDSFCKQEVVGNLVTHIGSGLDSEIDSSLDILSSLVENHIQAMTPYAIFVKGVLDYLDNLSVTQIRKLYSMLSQLAFYHPDEGGLIQDDLHIIIRKQLSSSNPKYKRMGVIGAIMVVKSIALVSDEEEKTLSEEMFKQVVSLLQLVRNSSHGMKEAYALFMDELSCVIAKGQLTKDIESWISENVTNDFQDDFVVDIEEDKMEKEWFVPMELTFGLNDNGESAIAIDLLPLVIKTKNRKANSRERERIPDPIYLAPNFRLVQTCENKQQDGNLEGIDAILGCPLYTVKRDAVTKISSLSQKEKETICETLFYEINWFIEMVNGFATQADPEMKAKVIHRLKSITSSRKLLERCLAETSKFKPPAANFDLEEKSKIPNNGPSTSGEDKKRGKKATKKKGGDKTNLNDSDENSRDSHMSEKESVSTQFGSESNGKENKSGVSLSNYRQYFRELDIHVFTILTSHITAVDTDNNTKNSEETKLQPPELDFLLEDLVIKLNHSLLATANKKRTFLKPKTDKNVGFSHLDQHTSKQLATKVIHLLPALCEHLEAASAFFQSQLAENDGVIDGPDSKMETSCQMTSILRHLLQAFLSVLSWNGFLISENRGLLKEALGVFVSRIKSTDTSMLPIHNLLSGTFQYLQNFSTTIFNLEGAVVLLKLLITVSNMSESLDLNEKIVSLARDLLKREWLDADGQKSKGQKHNELLQTVVRSYITHSNDYLEAIEAITTKAIPELIEADKNGCSDTFPSLTRNSFPVYFRVIFAQLVESSKNITTLKQTDTKQMKMEKLIKWNMAVRIHHVLVNILKVFDSRTILGTVLKYGRQFVEVFYRQAMPLLDNMFRFHREDVQSLVKAFQLSTRALHHLCGHSKIIKDVSLINQVPMMKKALEAFIYRVMLMLTVNKCPEAFWMGNLKNRDLQGGEILSQVSQTSATTEGGGESDEDVLPDDDDDESEVEMDEAEGSKDKGEESDEGSCSEIF